VPDGLRLVPRLFDKQKTLLDTSETGKRMPQAGADDRRQEGHHPRAGDVKALSQGCDRPLKIPLPQANEAESVKTLAESERGIGGPAALDDLFRASRRLAKLAHLGEGSREKGTRAVEGKELGMVVQRARLLCRYVLLQKLDGAGIVPEAEVILAEWEGREGLEFPIAKLMREGQARSQQSILGSVCTIS
jgi:phosphoglycolate phosphatase-like HAD superfamily hydrolase